MKKIIKCESCTKTFENKSKTSYCRFCRPCFRKRRNKYTAEWRKRNKNRIKKYKQREYVKEKARQYTKKYREEHPEETKEYDRIRKETKEYKEYIKIYNLKYQKEYRKNNRFTLSKNSRERYNYDPNFRISRILRGRIRSAFKKYIDGGKITSCKGYGIDCKAIIEHLKPFPKDLPKYHIDHIRPLCSFNFINEDKSINLEEIRRAFAPENHQWLLARDNLQKISEDLKIKAKYIRV